MLRTPCPSRLAVVAAVVATLLLVTGCGGSGTDAAPSPDASSPGTPAEQVAAWQTEEITDVEGRTFTIAGLAGKPVFVEAFATWCTNCRAQLGDTQEAAAALGDDAVFVALSVETDLDSDEVSAYARENGFDSIRFAVMSEEMLAALAADLGTTVANPPSTPHIVVAADGTVGALRTGTSSVETITGLMRAAAR